MGYSLSGPSLNLRGDMDLPKMTAAAEAAGVPPYLWFNVRDSLGALSVREKLRPAHWQEKLYFWFELESPVHGVPVNEGRIRAAITDMMNSSRPWCNPEIGVDEGSALKALRTALDKILVSQDSTGTGEQPVDDGLLSEPVDVTARTADLVRELGL